MGRDQNQTPRVDADVIHKLPHDSEAAFAAKINIDERHIRTPLLGTRKRLLACRGDRNDTDSLLLSSARAASTKATLSSTSKQRSGTCAAYDRDLPDPQCS